MLFIFSFDSLNVIRKIEQFEKQRNIKLPSLYTNFLEKYNGGYTPKTSFDINGISSDIRGFYGFQEKDENYNFLFLIKNNDVINWLNNDFLPIAVDSFGNFIMIGIGKINNGEIYFFDNEINKYSYLSPNIKDFISQINSQKFVVRSIEDRLKGMKESGSHVQVNDELLKLWQAEINKYSQMNQEIVTI